MGARQLPLLMILSLCAATSVRAADVQPESTAPPTTQPARYVIVEGQVFDFIGAGVKDAEVHVFVQSDGGRDEIASATTDEMGDFKITRTEPLRGKLILTFAKPGFKRHEVEVEYDPDDEFPPFVDYPMQGALEIKGVARDDLRQVPVVGAKVVARAAYNEWSATTDESGGFEIEDLPPCRGEIMIDADGFARLKRKFELGVPEGKQDAAPADSARPEPAAAEPMVQTDIEDGVLSTFLLKPERIVHLTITDPDGKPISKVVVESLVEADNDFRTSATDESGRLTLARLSIDAARIAFRLTHPGHTSSTTFDRTVDLPAGRTESSHTLIMAAAATITGKITDDAGAGLGGARLTVGRSLSEFTTTAFADFDGDFTLSGIPAGQALVTVHLAGYAPRLLFVEADPRSPVTLDVVLAPAVQTAGCVLDPEGKPVPGAHLLTVRWQGHNTLALQAMTDGQGRFTILDAPAEEFSINISAHGFKPLENQGVRGGETDLRFQFTEVQTPAPAPLLSKLKIGDAAPAFEVTALDGRRIKLADFKGKYVFVDFWATWCVPCVVEVPNVVALHKALGGRKDFDIIGVSLDIDEKAVRKYIKDNKLIWTQVFGDKSGADKMADQFGAVAIPATFLISPDGRIVAADLGGKQLTEQVRKLIDRPASS